MATGHHGVEHDTREETRVEDLTSKGNPGKCYKGHTHYRTAQVHPYVLPQLCKGGSVAS